MAPPPTSPNHLRAPLLVYSHLRWNFVYQRPQHVLSRIARRRRVVFIEEPVLDAGRSPHWEWSEPAPGILRCVPHTPIAKAEGFHDAQHPALERLLRSLVGGRTLTPHVAWLYTPLATPLARALAPLAAVYDCMDELSAFDGASPCLIERERALLAWADVVFTGGPSLYRAKQHRHPHVLCLPSSVDAAHFGQARDGLPEPADQAGIPHPRLGFFGVIDERIDRTLLAAVAAARPQWQLVLVGPVVKIDPATLPVAPNIHYIPQRDYAALPAYLAGWDVCLLPFARNASTRFISPTKTLEYMAAERPIVGTPIADVVDLYADVVRIGGSAEEFIAACDAALHEPAAVRARAMREIVGRTSWDATAAVMDEAVETAIRRRWSATVTGEGPWSDARSSSSAPVQPA